ncbi:MAG: hypothetical protein PHR49_06380 [Methanoculleus sp.]|jgi:hypothetical protein|nr:hypothetical protein [Methanoculleus sp. UBA377]MDD2473597.1 hypothetical protein [Methanoculleus sp.]
MVARTSTAYAPWTVVPETGRTEIVVKTNGVAAPGEALQWKSGPGRSRACGSISSIHARSW